MVCRALERAAQKQMWGKPQPVLGGVRQRGVSRPICGRQSKLRQRHSWRKRAWWGGRHVQGLLGAQTGATGLVVRAAQQGIARRGRPRLCREAYSASTALSNMESMRRGLGAGGQLRSGVLPLGVLQPPAVDWSKSEPLLRLRPPHVGVRGEWGSSMHEAKGVVSWRGGRGRGSEGCRRQEAGGGGATNHGAGTASSLLGNSLHHCRAMCVPTASLPHLLHPSASLRARPLVCRRLPSADEGPPAGQAVEKTRKRAGRQGSRELRAPSEGRPTGTLGLHLPM